MQRVGRAKAWGGMLLAKYDAIMSMLDVCHVVVLSSFHLARACKAGPASLFTSLVRVFQPLSCPRLAVVPCAGMVHWSTCAAVYVVAV